MGASRHNHMMRMFFVCTVVMLALSLFSFHDISRTSDKPLLRVPASMGIH